MPVLYQLYLSAFGLEHWWCFDLELAGKWPLEFSHTRSTTTWVRLYGLTDCMASSLPGSSECGILRAKYWSGLPCVLLLGTSWPRVGLGSYISCTGRRVTYHQSHLGRLSSKLLSITKCILNSERIKYKKKKHILASIK